MKTRPNMVFTFLKRLWKFDLCTLIRNSTHQLILKAHFSQKTIFRFFCLYCFKCPLWVDVLANAPENASNVSDFLLWFMIMELLLNSWKVIFCTSGKQSCSLSYRKIFQLVNHYSWGESFATLWDICNPLIIYNCR